MLLYLLRHGDAITSPTLHDSELPLSELGAQQAEAVSLFLKAAGVSLDLIVTSPLVRAQQMAAPTKNLLGIKKMITSKYLVPGSDQKQLFELLNSQRVETLLLVGHEPHLSTTIALLVSGDTSSRIEMKKASCACVEIAWPIEKGRGLLKWLVTVGQMKQIR
ncbi:MAG: phosphohistidine phosphatase SixA [Bacteroidota bacterium]